MNPLPRIALSALCLFSSWTNVPPDDMDKPSAGQHDPGPIVKKEVWIEPPEPGAAVFGKAEYCAPSGLRMIRLYNTISSSDRMNAQYRQYSEDNGKTWTPPEKLPDSVRYEGDLRREFADGSPICLDPARNIYVKFSREIIMPKGDVLEGCKQRKVFSQISQDGGQAFGRLKQLIEKGTEFSATHYLKGVWHKKNSATLNSHLILSAKELLLAVYIFPVDDKGLLYNPLAGYTYSDIGFIKGTLTDDASDIEWSTTQTLRLEPALSIRGMSEPSLARLRDGRILCLARGNQGAQGDATPGGSWLTVSQDQGRTWTPMKRLFFDDGGILYTPSSISQLLRHSSGRLYWIANIVSAPAEGNSPRYPLVLAEIDEKKAAVIRKSLVVIDTRQETESDTLQLSNFNAYEDRESHDIVVTLARLFRKSRTDWTAPLMKYSITLTGQGNDVSARDASSTVSELI